jgi:hypothetical protein
MLCTQWHAIWRQDILSGLRSFGGFQNVDLLKMG